MNRFIYWLKVRFSTKDSQCRHFCATCRYFDKCEEDLSLLYVCKDEKTTEVKTEVAIDVGKIQNDVRKVS